MISYDYIHSGIYDMYESGVVWKASNSKMTLIFRINCFQCVMYESGGGFECG